MPPPVRKDIYKYEQADKNKNTSDTFVPIRNIWNTVKGSRTFLQQHFLNQSQCCFQILSQIRWDLSDTFPAAEWNCDLEALQKPDIDIWENPIIGLSDISKNIFITFLKLKKAHMALYTVQNLLRFTDIVMFPPIREEIQTLRDCQWFCSFLQSLKKLNSFQTGLNHRSLTETVMNREGEVPMWPGVFGNTELSDGHFIKQQPWIFKTDSGASDLITDFLLASRNVTII